MFGSLDTVTSGLVAQRTRMEIISANLMLRGVAVDPSGNADDFRRRIAVFKPGDPASGRAEGVHVKSVALDRTPFRKVLDPSHPYAVNGYVSYPNIDPAMEMVSALEASRAYEANITAAEATKNMLQSSLRLLA